MNAVVVLEWSFSPPDYFEVPISVDRDDYAMAIADGKVEARIDAAIYDSDPTIRQRCHDALESRFLGAQLFGHKGYELSKSTMTRVHPDGRKDYFLEVESAHLVISGGEVDFRVTDKNGILIADTKRDRIERRKNLAELASTHGTTDALAVALLRSYDAAVKDPNNELVHLYEIREGLAVRFGGATSACSALGISSTSWSRLGQLCNNEPLRQGRHRGKSSGTLRDATEHELAETRGIARAMIEAYLRHLDRGT